MNPDDAPPLAFEEPYFGLVYCGDLQRFLDWNIYFYGAYEKANLLYLERLATHHRRSTGVRPVCWDIGANSGAHTLFLSTFAAHVYAFEPVASTRALLERNIARNRLHNVTVLPVALGEADSASIIRVPAGPTLDGRASLLPEVAEPDWRSEKVRVVAGDALIAQGLASPDIVKIDVEGFELYVLRGLRCMLERKRPAMLMELSPMSRKRFGGEDCLRAALYKDAVVRGLSKRTGRFRAFDYERSFDVAISPSP